MARESKTYPCPRCKNTRTDTNCSYCNWKGWEGAGAELKKILKEK